MTVRKESLLSYVVSLLVLACRSQDVCPDDQDRDWSYTGANGPSHWVDIGYPECDGQRQSGIDIPSNVTESSDGPLGYFSYSKPISGYVENTGTRIQILPTDGITRGVTVGSSVYSFQQFHFHLGAEGDKNNGSVHKISGKGYAMELHTVNMDHRSLYTGVAVFFEEGDTDNPILEPLIEAVNSVEYTGDRQELQQPIDLSSLFPKCRYTYYMYEGSVTTPPCSEIVTWLILRDPVPISTRQMQAFRKQHSVPRSSPNADQCYLVNNIRPLQPLNGRKITLYTGDC